MINISVKKKDDKVNYIKINGHADYADEGFDIVCASVSCITITTVNALIRYDEKSVLYTESDGLLEIGIMTHDDVIDMLVLNMIDLLSNLQEQYDEFIKIR